VKPTYLFSTNSKDYKASVMNEGMNGMNEEMNESNE
jgi:hypothetical protein